MAPRESETVRLVIAGYEYTEIAERLRIGTSTVKNRMHHIAEKCGFRNRTQVAVWFALHPEQLSDVQTIGGPRRMAKGKPSKGTPADKRLKDNRKPKKG